MASNSNFSTPTLGTPVQAATRMPKPDISVANGSPLVNEITNKPVACVFCGASSGNSDAHLQAARDLAKSLHENNFKLVYGGGTTGIMGEVARSLVALSGPDSVHGIIPDPLVKFEQKGTAGIDPAIYGKTTVVKDMHTRKRMMADEVVAGGAGSGFVALTGGFGTLEELMEVTTWNQLGIHKNGVVVFNVAGYYDGLMQWVRSAVKSGFIAEANGSILVEAKSAEETVKSLMDYEVSKARFNLNWDSEG